MRTAARLAVPGLLARDRQPVPCWTFTTSSCACSRPTCTPIRLHRACRPWSLNTAQALPAVGKRPAFCLQRDVSALSQKRWRARAPASGKLIAESQPVEASGSASSASQASKWLDVALSFKST